MPRPARSASAIRASVFADLAPHLAAFAARGGELVPLHIGDTHVAPPEASRASPRPGDERYGAITGLPALREACARRLEREGRGPESIDPERELLVACGATHALFCAARAALDPGDEVLVASPYWPLSVGVLRSAGAVPVEVPLTQALYAGRGGGAGEIFAAAVTPRTRALTFITPNNPDGKVLGPGDLEAIARVAQAHDLWVIADEVYADYTYDGAPPHRSIARLPGMRERTLTAYSFSKSHALAGARVGFCVGPAEVMTAAQRVSTHTIFNVPVAGQRAALAASADDAWIEGARAQYLAARDETVRALEGTGARFFVPEGGSYVFVDFAPVLGERPLEALLVRAIERGVLLAPGGAFGAGFERFARLCFTAVPPPALREGLSRLRAAIAAL